MGVQPNAPQDEIRDAYLRLARSLHPDRHEGGTATERQLAERRMREVNEAWRVLGDPAARASYDQELKAPTPPPRPTRSGTSAGSADAPRSGPPGTFGSAEPSGPLQGEAIIRPSRRPSVFSGTRGSDGMPVNAVMDQMDDDDAMDGPALRPGEVFFLRRVPVLIAIAIGLAIFIGTAYIGTSNNTSNTPNPVRFPTTIPCRVVEPGSCGG
jgi:curved DNA-binding protein CbpA